MDTRLTSMAIRMAPRADRLSFFTRRPPRKIPRQAQGIAVIPGEKQRGRRREQGKQGQWMQPESPTHLPPPWGHFLPSALKELRENWGRQTHPNRGNTAVVGTTKRQVREHAHMLQESKYQEQCWALRSFWGEVGGDSRSFGDFPSSLLIRQGGLSGSVWRLFHQRSPARQPMEIVF